MKILFYEPINQIQNLAVNSLIGGGFHVVALNTVGEILSNLMKTPYPVLICDIDQGTAELLNIIKDIKKTDDLSKIKVIAFTANSDRAFLTSFVKVGVEAFILKPFVPEKFMLQLNKNLEKLFPDEDASKRAHIRINPDPRDNSSVTVRTGQSFKVVTGSIVNISLGGLLFKTSTEGLAEIQVKTLLQNMQIKLKTTTIEASAVVVAKQEDVVAVKFFKIEDYAKNVLSRYIYQYLQIDQKAK